MIVEERIYTLIPGAAPEFMKHYEEFGLETQTEILGNLVGWYYTEAGPLNQIVHLWGYVSFEDRLERRKKLAADPRWPEYLKRIRPLTVTQENKILIKAPWSP